jgi:uncharacterized membrane protein
MGAVPSSKGPAWWRWALLAVTVLSSGLRFAFLGDKTLWLDEAFSLWMARHEPPVLFDWLIGIDHHPPLYYILLHLWIGWLGDTPAALRSLSALASSLAIPLYALAARKLAGAACALVAALLLAIAPFHIRYAQETRMYGLLTLAVALLFWALAHLLTARADARRRRGWTWALLAAAEAAAMLTHNTATVLVPLALNGAIGGLWLLQRRGSVDDFPGLEEPRFYRSWLWSQLGALLLWSPWAAGFVRQAQVVVNDFWIEAPDTWRVWLALGSLSFAYLPEWLPQRDYLQWLALFLVLWGIWLWRRSVALTWLLLALWLLPPLVELVASVRRPIFYDRTLIWTTFPYYLLIARGMVLPEPVRRAWRWGWLLLSLIVISGLCALGVRNYFLQFEKEDWDLAARYVAERALPQELILFHASWAQLPFDYYYTDDFLIDGPPLQRHGIPADLFDAGALEPAVTEAARQRLLSLVEGQERLWLVYSHWWYTDPEGLLPRMLEEQFELAQEQEWPGIRVLLYRRR